MALDHGFKLVLKAKITIVWLFLNMLENILKQFGIFYRKNMIKSMSFLILLVYLG